MVKLEKLGLQTSFHKGIYRVFLGTLLVTAVAKGMAFLPGYSIDDYRLVLRDSPSLDMLRQGRIAQAGVVQILHLLQLEGHHARVFFVAFALVMSALLAVLVVRHWGFGTAGWVPVAAASCISIHPYTTEIFTFRTALGINMFAYALLGLLLIPRRWSWAGVCAGALVFAVAVSIYQAVLQYALMILLMGAAVGLTRLLVAGRAAGWPRRITALLSWRRIPRDRKAALLACTVLGMVVYTLVNTVVARVLHLDLVNHRLLSPGRIGERAAAVWNILRYRFLDPSPLLNQFSKRLLLLLLFLALVGLLVRTWPWLRPRSALLLVVIAGLLAASLVWTVGIELVLQDFWPVPRVMAHVGVFWAGVLAVAWLCWGPRARSVLGFLSALIVLTFIGGSNRVLNDQIRLNVRDAAKASRIIARLEEVPGFSGTEPIAVHGTDWTYPLAYGTSDNDLNISAFGPEWSQEEILREISGYDLQPTKDDAARKAAAAAYCRNVQPWPDPESVTIKDGLAIVCLGS